MLSSWFMHVLNVEVYVLLLLLKGGNHYFSTLNSRRAQVDQQFPVLVDNTAAIISGIGSFNAIVC